MNWSERIIQREKYKTIFLGCFEIRTFIALQKFPEIDIY